MLVACGLFEFSKAFVRVPERSRRGRRGVLVCDDSHKNARHTAVHRLPCGKFSKLSGECIHKEQRRRNIALVKKVGLLRL